MLKRFILETNIVWQWHLFTILHVQRTAVAQQHGECSVRYHISLNRDVTTYLHPSDHCLLTESAPGCQDIFEDVFSMLTSPIPTHLPFNLTHSSVFILLTISPKHLSFPYSCLLSDTNHKATRFHCYNQSILFVTTWHHFLLPVWFKCKMRQLSTFYIS